MDWKHLLLQGKEGFATLDRPMGILSKFQGVAVHDYFSPTSNTTTVTPLSVTFIICEILRVFGRRVIKGGLRR